MVLNILYSSHFQKFAEMMQKMMGQLELLETKFYLMEMKYCRSVQITYYITNDIAFDFSLLPMLSESPNPKIPLTWLNVIHFRIFKTTRLKA